MKKSYKDTGNHKGKDKYHRTGHSEDNKDSENQQTAKKYLNQPPVGQFQRPSRKSLPVNPSHQHLESLRRNTVQMKSFGYAELETLLTKDCNEILMTFMTEEENFKKLFLKTMDPKVTLLIMDILLKLLDADFETMKLRVHNMVLKSRCLQNIETFISRDSPNTDKFWNALYVLCNKLCSLGENSENLLKLIKTSIKVLIELKLYKNILSSFESLCAQISDNANSLNLDMSNLHLNDDTAGDKEVDFRSLSLYPYQRELLSDSRPAFKNEFNNVEEYIKLQFHSLRDDFTSIAHESIQDYKSKLKEIDKPEFLPYIFIYHKANFVRTKRVRNVNGVVVKFEGNEGTDMKIGNRLKTSSLVLFTKDRFASVILGVVVESNQQMYANCEVVVHLVNNDEIDYNTDYEMGECQVYFHPYYLSMKALQHIHDFPMSQYVASNKPTATINKPKYLSAKTFYTIDGKRFPVLQENAWPDSKVLNLDSSQYSAFKNALTQEFVMIQGAYGTGKTHLILKLIKALLDNVPDKQILIISASNRCLDHLLEKALTFTDRLARLGGQSKSEKLIPYTLKEIMNRNKIHGKVLYSTYTAINRNEREINMLMKDEGRSLSSHQGNVQKRLQDLQKESDELNKTLQDIHLCRNVKMLQTMNIVGLTSSGAAFQHDLIKLLNPAIVIMEEANEIASESHVVTSLGTNCEHLMLFGNDQQMEVIEEKFPLKQHQIRYKNSLFLRMIQNGIECNTLNVQHRMRPEIAALIVPTIYKTLQNHPNVLNYPPIVGMTKSVFFLSHHESEEFDEKISDKKNMHEVKVLLELAKYLILQGYEPKDVTILTVHRGQLFAMQKACEKHERRDVIKDVSLKLMENYQGDESKIVLLSLTRSNDRDESGRINFAYLVAQLISRAKEGLYIMGNIDMFMKVPSVWSDIKETLTTMDAIGTALPLKCQNHPEVITYVSDVDDFQKVPDRGCMKMCEKLQKCGHKCPHFCHLHHTT